MSGDRSLRNLWGLLESPKSISHPSQIAAELEAQMRGVVGNQLGTSQVLRVSTVYICVAVNSDGMASVPFAAVRIEGKNRIPVDDHWIMDLLRNPCRGFTTQTWVWLIQYCVELKGAAYCRIVWSRGRVVELFPLDPDKVKPRRRDDGELVFDHTNARGEVQSYDSTEIWHVMRQTLDGINGLSPIAYQMETFNNAYRATSHASNSLKNGASVGFALSVPGRLKPETRQAMKDDYKAKHAGGSNAGNLMILEEGAKAEKLSMSMAEFQFIESRGFTRGEIAAIFGVPPHRVGDASKSTFTIEQHGIEYVTNTLMPRARMWELSLERLMTNSRDRVQVKMNLNALMRGDMKSRYLSYASGIASGWMTRNEARELEDRNPIAGLDEPLTPMNSMGDKPGKPSDPNKPEEDEADEIDK